MTDITLPIVRARDGKVASTRLLIRCLWRRFLAFYRLSNSAVCQESVGHDGHHDYHDYTDSVEYHEDNLGAVHFYEYTCRSCVKRFYI